jgi:hypothetical protein
MIADGKLIVGIDFGADSLLYYIDTTKVIANRFANKGQGPNDVVHPMTLNLVREGYIGFYDYTLRMYNEAAIPVTKEFKIDKKTRIGAVETLKVVKNAYGQFVGIGAYKDGMYCLMDSTGKALSYFFEYPYANSREKSISNRLRGMAYQGDLFISPDGKHMVYACTFGDILRFYSLKNDAIEEVKRLDKKYIEYETEEIGTTISAPIYSTNEIGYVGGAVTDSLILLLKGTSTLAGYKEAGRSFDSDYLLVYTWEGDLVEAIQMDVPCTHICISPDGKKLWAIANLPDPTLVSFLL